MITIELDKSNNCNGDYSLYLKFPYNQNIVNIIRDLPIRYWHKEQKEWEIPFKYFDKLKDIFKNYQLNIVNYDEIKKLQVLNQKQCNYIPKDYKFKINAFKHQIEGINFGLKNDKFVLGDEQGLGKAQPYTCTIYTPEGKTTMGELKVGTKVLGTNSKTYEVTNIYEKGDLPVYRITFNDGSFTECCNDHLWSISVGKNNKKLITKSLRGIKNIYLNQRCYIPMCSPINFIKKELPIHPYVLGALLGDGCLSKNIGFTSADKEIVKRINKLLPEKYVLNNTSAMSKYDYRIICKDKVNHSKPIYYADNKKIGTIDDVYDFLISENKIKSTIKKNCVYMYLYPKALEKNSKRYGINWTIELPENTKGNLIKYKLDKLGLLGTNSHTKFIPEIYKYSTYEDRLELLQGLIDTDGYISKYGTIQYTSVSTKLLYDVKELVESFGGNAKVNKDNITLTIKLPNEIIPCKLTRKLERLNLNKKYKPIRIIQNIEYIGYRTCRCITVNSPDHLYLTDNFICTHNTMQAINIAVIKKAQQNYKHCLIICGVNGLKWNWKSEVEKHSNEQAYILGTRYDKKGREKIGTIQDRLEDLRVDSDNNFINPNMQENYFIITNIETLRNEDIIRNLKALCDMNVINMLVLDEGHKCKDPTSIQGKHLLKLKADSMISMTGTPLMNYPLDLYIHLKWLGYESHGFYSFKQHYCIYGGYGGYQIIGYKNLDQLKEQFDDIMLRRLKKDVLDLPEKIHTIDYVELGAKQKKIYKEVYSEIKNNIDLVTTAVNPLTEMIRLRQATAYTGILSSTIKESAKFERLLEILDELGKNNKKAIIFSNWTSVINPLYQILESYNPAIITGETKDRVGQEKKFMEDESCKVIVGTIGAMGTGLTLTAANTVIFLDEPWNKAIKDQAEDRAHRIGTTENINIITLIAKDTIDERINEIVEKKGAMADMLIDGKLTPQSKQELVEFLLS